MACHPFSRLLVAFGVAVIGVSVLAGLDALVVVPVATQAAPTHDLSEAEDTPAPPPAPDLASLNETIIRPLFSHTRRPPSSPVVHEAAPPPPKPPPPQLSLRGVLLTDNSAIALLCREDTTEALLAHPGDTVDGWRLDQINSDAVKLSGPDGPISLPLFDADHKATPDCKPVRPPQSAPTMRRNLVCKDTAVLAVRSKGGKSLPIPCQINVITRTDIPAR